MTATPKRRAADFRTPKMMTAQGDDPAAALARLDELLREARQQAEDFAARFGPSAPHLADMQTELESRRDVPPITWAVSHANFVGHTIGELMKRIDWTIGNAEWRDKLKPNGIGE